MNFVNLTPWRTYLVGGIVLEGAERPAYAVDVFETVAISHDIRIVRCTNTNVHDLPEPQDGVIYIVTSDVRQALPERKDLATLLAPRYGGPTLDYLGHESVLIN